ncbi:FAD-dependent oxidoreductase [Aeromicrobium senzhongii]|uniref:ferredoxin--NADP(+) reductase n=1 Tax=Aeromicrobium senzhongii TaxID=2663859 RepID=A0ABX6T0F4_9ACTN|nr:FAD-dependent oxidoreductase [Aeromicrobium senzhongii]MTB88047.1 ferredoxin-NADP reductase [Aeromicrobium senzhongii]QNL94950.1 FAD-dependent oxidoreductase [Aeromicrobium senzhongii]
MAYAITQSCCKDASCVSVCPVDCIHPTPDEPDFGTAEILYVDPQVCIDCGACADACPVAAPKAIDLLRGSEAVFAQLNAAYFEQRPERESPQTHTWDEMGGDLLRPLSIAIVGTGPAAAYAARELLLSTDAKITMIDRLPVPGGLVRGGVAPDHTDTKKFAELFHWAYKHPRTKMVMNVEVGRDISHQEVLQHHDAVIYGVGARRDRELGVPGEDLAGVYAAPDVVGWYNGALDIDTTGVVLAGDRVVVVGNGNVALDLARLLLHDPAVLARTDMPDHAVKAFRDLDVREVVLLGRRGPSAAAFTRPELLMMPPGIDVVVARDEFTEGELAEAEPDSNAAVLAALPLVDVDLTAPPSERRRLVFAFGRQVVSVEGEQRVEAVQVAPSGVSEQAVTVPCGTLIRATGHRGTPVPGLPFDEETATVPNESGRVVDPASGQQVPGTYVVGWIKRGANGGIGTNRTCAHETIAAIVADANAGRIAPPPRPRRAFGAFVRMRVDHVVGRRRMLAIEKAEEKRGAREGRPRVKFESVDQMLKVSPVTPVH